LVTGIYIMASGSSPTDYCLCYSAETAPCSVSKSDSIISWSSFHLEFLQMIKTRLFRSAGQGNDCLFCYLITQNDGLLPPKNVRCSLDSGSYS
jgi:hypothetical protein